MYFFSFTDITPNSSRKVKDCENSVHLSEERQRYKKPAYTQQENPVTRKESTQKKKKKATAPSEMEVFSLHTFYSPL